MSSDSARKHISEIRREKFGLNEDGMKRPSPLERDLRQALGHLAIELYSKKHHFILELIQNAEDNVYPEGETAMLSLKIHTSDPTNTPGSDGCLLLLNNEVGFQPDQVLSLCSVGQSTKTKCDGYIGEKGIGFKSVFQITARPHVFSNGYQFCFQRPASDDELGYIVPKWIEIIPDVIQQTNARTAILLPLISGERESIAVQLAAVPPETILFLNKLSALHIDTGTSKRTVIRDARDGVVTLDSNGSQTRYFVVRAGCPRPGSVTEEKRYGIKERELTIALPLTEPEKCTGRIFAFLPTECDSGLPFLINADFLLTTSRESLLADRLWNLWLRDCVAPTFTATFKLLLKIAEWRTEAYRFVPVEDDLNQQLADFLRPSVEAIQNRLREEACVLTVKDTFVRPEEAWLAGKVERTLLVQSDSPPGMSAFLFVAPELERWRDRLKPLHVAEFTIRHFLIVINDGDWLERRDETWWEVAFSLFADRKIKASDVSEIPILRCSDNVCRLPDSNSVFLGNDLPETRPILPTGGPAVHIISAGVQQRLQSNHSAWIWLTQTLGIHPFSLSSYIVDRLLPWMRTQTGEGAHQRLIEVTRFVVANLACLDESSRTAVRGQLPWVLEDGRIVTPADRNGRELVEPEILQGTDGWNWVFIGASDREHFLVVADAYVPGDVPEARQTWKEFFKVCSVTPIPDPARRELDQGSDPYNDALARCATDVPGTPLLLDSCCPRWLRDLTSVEATQNGAQKVTALVALLKAFSVDHAASFLQLSQKHLHGQMWQPLRTESESVWRSRTSRG